MGFEIAIYKPKFIANLGIVLRSAQCFGADAINLIGHRYKKRVCTDTMNTARHVPVKCYDKLEDMVKDKYGMDIIAAEVDGEDIDTFNHPDNCIYVFGGEDMSVPSDIAMRIKINTDYCINVAMAVSIVCFHRKLRQT